MEHQQANVSGVSKSVVSIGTSGSITNTVIESTGGAHAGSLPDLLAELSALLPRMPLAPDVRDEIQAEIGTAQAQLGSPRPRQPIIQECLRTIRALLEDVAGNAAYAGIIGMLEKMIV
jgi:hypothetical protein